MIRQRVSDGFKACATHPERIGYACPECWITSDDTNRVKRTRFVEAARAMVGVQFQFEGRSDLGVDCAGIVAQAAINGGLERQRDHRNYSRELKDREFLALWAGRMDIVQGSIARPSLALPGDVVLMIHRRDLRHAAILSDRGSIIHASTIRGCVVEDELNPHRAVMIRYVMRFREFRTDG